MKLTNPRSHHCKQLCRERIHWAQVYSIWFKWGDTAMAVRKFTVHDKNVYISIICLTKWRKCLFLNVKYLWLKNAKQSGLKWLSFVVALALHQMKRTFVHLSLISCNLLSCFYKFDIGHCFSLFLHCKPLKHTNVHHKIAQMGRKQQIGCIDTPGRSRKLWDLTRFSSKGQWI